MMKGQLVAVLALLSGLAGGCEEYFQGSTLYFTFSRLEPLQTLTDEDLEAVNRGAGGLCADDAYVAAHPERDSPYEYRAWATINGGPVLIARFTVRECTFAKADNAVKKAVTTVSYVRDPVYGYPDAEAGSELYGVVDQVVMSLSSGGVTMMTDVRLDTASEIFITRQPRGGDLESPMPDPKAVLMEGSLRRVGGVLRAELDSRMGSASGVVTVVVTERSPQL